MLTDELTGGAVHPPPPNEPPHDHDPNEPLAAQYGLHNRSQTVYEHHTRSQMLYGLYNRSQMLYERHNRTPMLFGLHDRSQMLYGRK